MRTILSLIFLLVLALPAFAAKHAFILANADYEQLADLGNTHADADAYGEAFEGFGYQVTQKRDLSRSETIQALDAFLLSVKPGDEVVFIYAGHGWSDGQDNFLVPTDAPRKASTRVLKRQSFALRNGVTGILDELESLGVSLTVAIIDACRDNPFVPVQGTRSVGLSRGLARVSAPKGTFIIFSAGEGQQALDGLPQDPPDQKLSVFTRVFVPLLVSGVTLESAISSAQSETAQLALRYNGHEQHPAYYDQTLGDTCLKGDCLGLNQVALKPANDVCSTLYQEAKSEKACFAYEAYAKSCPDHVFAPLAQSFIARSCAKPNSVTAELDQQEATQDVQKTREMASETQVEETEDSLQLSRSARREIQRRLSLLDYDPGGVDGIFGDRTRNAISMWQFANGIRVSGYLNSSQIDKLNSQSEAEYVKFTTRQRSQPSSAPKTKPAPARNKPRTPAPSPKPTVTKQYTCYLTPKGTGGLISATHGSVSNAREAAIAKCGVKTGYPPTHCRTSRIYCKETTGG